MWKGQLTTLRFNLATTTLFHLLLLSPQAWWYHHAKTLWPSHQAIGYLYSTSQAGAAKLRFTSTQSCLPSKTSPAVHRQSFKSPLLDSLQLSCFHLSRFSQSKAECVPHDAVPKSRKSVGCQYIYNEPINSPSYTGTVKFHSAAMKML